MTYGEVDHLARLLIDADHYLSVMIYQIRFYHQTGPTPWEIRVQEAGDPTFIYLPDALSVRAYLDARRGYRPEAGAPDFGPGRV